MEEIYEPLGDGLIVKPQEKQSVSSGGILIPETAREDALRGEVIAVGPDCTIKQGDTVAYTKHGGVKLIDNLLIFKEPHILAVIKSKDDK
jgi:chaperonin GroES